MVRDCQSVYPHLHAASAVRVVPFHRARIRDRDQGRLPMPHNVRSPHARGVRSSSKLALIAMAGMAFLVSASVAHADAVRSKREIAKASAKFAQAKMKV